MGTHLHFSCQTNRPLNSTMKSIGLVLLAAVLFNGASAQFYGGFGGFGGFGFGCASYLPTVGNQCYQPTQDGTLYCQASASSQYANTGYFGDYRAYLAVDGFLAPGNSGFYHSNLETYPWLKIEFKKVADNAADAKDVNRVQIYQRCDANELYHQTNFEVRATDTPGKIFGTPRLTGGKFCGTTSQVFFTGGTSFTVPCPTPVTGAKEVWIQKTTLHSHGSGWPNYNGNQWNSYTGNSPAQNSNWPVCFLMINEVVIY